MGLGSFQIVVIQCWRLRLGNYAWEAPKTRKIRSFVPIHEGRNGCRRNRTDDLDAAEIAISYEASLRKGPWGMSDFEREKSRAEASFENRTGVRVKEGSVDA